MIPWVLRASCTNGSSIMKMTSNESLVTRACLLSLLIENIQAEIAWSPPSAECVHLNEQLLALEELLASTKGRLPAGKSK